MTLSGYVLVGLLAIVALVVLVLLIAVLRFAAAARRHQQRAADSAGSTVLTAALEDAIARLKAQERATAARADRSEALSSEIVASLSSGLVVVDAAGQVQIANPASRRLLGGAPAVSDQQMIDRAPTLRAVLDEALRTMAPVRRRTVTLQTPDGPMHLGVTVSFFGGAGGAICLFTDLTAALAREEQLRLKEALAQLGELSAGLAHEFRNGLATIHGYARLLDPDTLPSPQRTYVEELRHATAALGEVVTNFLNFARPEPLGLAPTALKPIIERAAEDVPDAVVIIAGEFGVIDGDEVLLRQALSNLIRNSVEASAAEQPPPTITIAGRIDDERRELVISIADTGPGIGRDALPRVFQPFFTTKATGTGLGLAIVQKIIVGHNGRITADNGPAGGALFTIVLPLAAR